MTPERSDPAPSRDWEAVPITPGYNLQYRWATDRERLNRSEVYSALRKSDGLLSEDFLIFAKKLVSFDSEIERAVDLADIAVKAYKSKLSPWGEDLRRLLGGADSLANVSRVVRSNDVASDLAMRIVQGKITKSALRAIMSQVINACVELSGRIADQEEKLQSTVGDHTTPLSSSTSLYICHCRRIQLGRKRICEICGKTPSEPPTSIHRVDKVLVDIVQNNRWLELAVARIFEKAGFRCLIGAQVLGLSGAIHEVDVLAYDSSKGIVVCSEATIGNANLAELASLLVRREDLHFHGTVLVSTNSTDPSAIRFAKAHGIGLFADIRRNSASLREWIKNLRSSYGLVSSS